MRGCYIIILVGDDGGWGCGDGGIECVVWSMERG